MHLRQTDTVRGKVGYVPSSLAIARAGAMVCTVDVNEACGTRATFPGSVTVSILWTESRCKNRRVAVSR